MESFEGPGGKMNHPQFMFLCPPSFFFNGRLESRNGTGGAKPPEDVIHSVFRLSSQPFDSPA